MVQICKKILCRLFWVFVHVYIHHFDRLIVMGAEAHVNTCYKHFYYFVTEMNLIDRKELEPLVSDSAVCRHAVRATAVSWGKEGAAEMDGVQRSAKVHCSQISVLRCAPGGDIIW